MWSVNNKRLGSFKWCYVLLLLGRLLKRTRVAPGVNLHINFNSHVSLRPRKCAADAPRVFLGSRQQPCFRKNTGNWGGSRLAMILSSLLSALEPHRDQKEGRGQPITFSAERLVLGSCCREPGNDEGVRTDSVMAEGQVMLTSTPIWYS